MQLTSSFFLIGLIGLYLFTGYLVAVSFVLSETGIWTDIEEKKQPEVILESIGVIFIYPLVFRRIRKRIRENKKIKKEEEGYDY